MKLARTVIGVAFALASGFAAGTAWAAEQLHGESDSFAARGVALAWAVLRGPGEDRTFVVTRVATDAARHAAVSAHAVDPFTNARRELLSATRVGAGVELRRPRAEVADHPRVEFGFHAPGSPAAAPALVVYYLGVPDTTPEFTTEEAVKRHLDDRIAKLRAQMLR
ncbi:MAG: hypothetical protein KJZ83_04170 [Burkholderiaceae bacterium]|nr:hypothetical protein [Burkholderiaceae bacterium]